MKGDIAFDLLQQLVDMAIEHCHRTETAKSLRPIFGAPAPRRIDLPQRDVGQPNNGLAGRTTLEVMLEPFELVRAGIALAARPEPGNVDERDKMYSARIETVPAARLRLWREAGKEWLADVDQHVVLTWMKCVSIPVSLTSCCAVSHFVSRHRWLTSLGVKRKRATRSHGADVVKQSLEGCRRVRIWCFVEADMRIADLDQAQARRIRSRSCRVDDEWRSTGRGR
jgi:hypothetical protein